MNPDERPTAEIPVADLIALAIEHWRLSIWLATAVGNTGIARHAVRRMGDLLTRWQIETQSLDGRSYDAGLAVKVIDTVDDPGIPAGTDTVDETTSPLVIWRGEVVRAAEVVVRRGTAKV